MPRPWASFKHLHAAAMGQLQDGAEVGTDSVIRRVVHEHGHGVRVVLDGLFYFLHFHSQGDAKLLVHLRVYINRNGAAEHHGVDDALVDVSRQDDLIAGLADRKDHTLDCRRGSAHHQVGTGCAEGLGRQLL